MAISFGEVQKLKVSCCSEFNAIVTAKSRREGDDEDGGTQVLLLPKLNMLRLEILKNLSEIVPKGFTLKWSSLKTLYVSESGVEMRIQAGPLIERQTLLTSLQSMWIDGVESLEFLSRHIPGGFSCKIRDMNVPAHEQLSSVFSPSMIRAFDHLEDISIKKLDSEVVFNLEEECSVRGEAKIAELFKLNFLTIEWLHNMTHVWSKVPRNFEGFHHLTSIRLWFYNSLRYYCSPSIAKCLVKLQEVNIQNCEMLEEVVCSADEEGEKEVQKRSDDIVFIPQLQELALWMLPRLICISLGVCEFEKLSMEAPNAETTQMLHHNVTSPSSSSISTVICTEKSNSTPLASMRTGGIRRLWSFLHLTTIELNRCYNMTTLFPPNIQVNLPVLETLIIRGYNKLRYIFSSNPTLRSLKTLNIHRCIMLEVIVKDDVEGAGRSKFVFPTLTHVYLGSLPNLEGFCLGKSTFDWPSLTKLKIEDCLKMKCFTSGCSTIPLLDHLFVNSIKHNLAEEGGDINTTLTSAIEKDIDSTKTALREQGILLRNGFTLAGDHLVAQCSSWQWKSRFAGIIVKKPR